MSKLKYIKSFKVRLLPTKEQEETLLRTAGGCRFIWNTYLEFQIMNYKGHKITISKKDIVDTSKLFFKLLQYMKKNVEDYKWITMMSLHSINGIMRDMHKAYDKFFEIQGITAVYTPKVLRKCKKLNRLPYKHERKGHPQFKSKITSEVSIPYDKEEVYFKKDDNDEYLVQIPKIGKIKVQTNQEFPEGMSKNAKNCIHYIMNPRVKFIHNKWLLYFSMECESDPVNLNLNKVIGIDLGIKELCVATHCSNNNFNNCKIYHNINNVLQRIDHLERRLIRLQRRLSKKYKLNKSYKRTKNIEKLLKQIRHIYYELHNIRINYLHHVSREILDKFPRTIVLEDIDLSFMIQNHNIAKHEIKQLLGAFRQMLIYKAKELGIEVVLANRTYPSTQICSNCGHQQKMELNERVYKCPNCGLEIDRDINAAINLEHYGVYNYTAFVLNNKNKAG